jgi:hypothetical protein
VRCYFGDDEERWVMWYAGRNKEAPALDVIAPSSGSTGAPLLKRYDGSSGLPKILSEGHDVSDSFMYLVYNCLIK